MKSITFNTISNCCCHWNRSHIGKRAKILYSWNTYLSAGLHFFLVPLGCGKTTLLLALAGKLDQSLDVSITKNYGRQA